MNDYLSVIKRSVLFKEMADTEINEFLRFIPSNVKNFKKGEFILHSGEKTEFIGCVILGTARIVKEDYWGNRVIIAELEPGELFGETYACTDEISEVSVYASEDSEILFIGISSILDFGKKNPAVIENLVRVLAEKNLYLNRKIGYISQHKIRNRLLAYLSDASKDAESNDFYIPFNRQELADFLSVDRSALSSELCRLRDEKVLKFNKNHFILL